MTYFKGKIGEDLVKKYKYSISTKDGNSLVDAYNWNSLVKKGKELVMSINMEKVALVDKGKTQAQRNTCPRCYKTDLGVMEDDGWFQW